MRDLSLTLCVLETSLNRYIKDYLLRKRHGHSEHRQSRKLEDSVKRWQEATVPDAQLPLLWGGVTSLLYDINLTLSDTSDVLDGCRCCASAIHTCARTLCYIKLARR